MGRIPRSRYGGKTHWPIGLTPERLGFDEYFCADERERLAVETAALLVSSMDFPLFQWLFKGGSSSDGFSIGGFENSGGSSRTQKARPVSD